MRRALALCLGLLVLLLAAPAAATFIPQSGTITYNSTGGPTISLDGSTDVSLDSGNVYGTDTVRLNASDGKINFTSLQETDAKISVANLSDSQWTNLTAIDATASNLQVDPGGQAEFVVGEDIETVAMRDDGAISLDDGQVDFEYSGTSGESLVEHGGVPSDAVIAAVDADTGTVLDKAVSDGSNTVTFDALTNSEHSVVLQSSQVFEPDASALSPSGTLRFEDQTLAVDISDGDFPNDEVTVEFLLDGTTVSTQSTTSNTTLSHSVSGIADGTHNFTVVATDSFGELVVREQSFTIDHFEPTINDSTASPTGDLQNDVSSLAVDISDRDFPLDGDQLDVTIDFDGQQVSSQTLNSNGTATAAISSPDGGPHSWTVTVTDQYGNTVTETYELRVPSTVEVYNETDPDALVSGLDIQIRFFGTEQVFNKSTGSSGTINMTGLPVSQPFVVRANPPSSSDFESRRIYIESIYDQESIYLLNTNATQESNITLQVEDQTGEFDTPILKISRPLTKDFNGDGSSTTEFRTISGDRLNAGKEYPATLQTDIRYRIRVVNSQGDVRELGNIVPRTDRVYNLEIEGIVGNASATEDGLLITANQSIGQVQGSRVKSVQFAVKDATNRTTEIRLTVHEAGNASNVFDTTKLVDQRGIDEFRYTQVFSSNESVNTTLVANYTIIRGENDNVISGVKAFGTQQFNVASDLSRDWGAIFGIGFLIVLGGLFSVGNARIGALIVPAAAFVLHIAGIITAVASIGSIGLAFALAVGINLVRTSGGVLNK